jgi:hypothetical protein
MNSARYLVVEFSGNVSGTVGVGIGVNNNWEPGRQVSVNASNQRTVVFDLNTVATKSTANTNTNGFRIFLFRPSGATVTRAYLSNTRTAVSTATPTPAPTTAPNTGGGNAISVGGQSFPVSFALPTASASVGGRTQTYQHSTTEHRWYFANQWWTPADGATNYVNGLTTPVMNSARTLVVEFSSNVSGTVGAGIGVNNNWEPGRQVSVNASNQRAVAIDLTRVATKSTANTDTNGFRIFLFRPNGATVTRAYLSNTAVSGSSGGGTATPAPTVAPTPAPTPTPTAPPATGGNSNARGRMAFPQMPASGNNRHYTIQPILPNNRTRAQMNSDIINYFNRIENSFIIEQGTNVSNNPDAFHMVQRHFYSTTQTAGQITTSESMGYGMLILAYMAGAPGDGGAVSGGINLRTVGGRRLTIKDYFDGMHRTHTRFPTNVGTSLSGQRRLISWEITGSYNMSTVRNTGHTTNWRATQWASSATDGDLDMAYAYLLAHRQWGSNGRINYLQHAQWMIEAIWLDVVDSQGTNPINHHLKPGNWGGTGTSANITRPSDFNIYQLRAFGGTIRNDAGQTVRISNRNWQQVIDATKDAIGQGTDPALRTSVSSTNRSFPALNLNRTTRTGLLPDFQYYNRSTRMWRPSTGEWFVEGYSPADRDRRVGFNACRVPWRLTTDVLLNGRQTIRYRTATNTWNSSFNLQTASIQPWFNTIFRGSSSNGGAGGNFNNIRMYHYMDGSGSQAGWSGNVDFGAPLALAASLVGTQAEVNTAWDYMRNVSPGSNEFGAYYNLICMLTASGNIWCPTKY